MGTIPFLYCTGTSVKTGTIRPLGAYLTPVLHPKSASPGLSNVSWYR